MRYEQLLQGLIYRYGGWIRRVNVWLGLLCFVLSLVFLFYAWGKRKETGKKALGLNGFTIFLIYTVFLLLYPVKIGFGQILMTYLGK